MEMDRVKMLKHAQRLLEMRIPRHRLDHRFWAGRCGAWSRNVHLLQTWQNLVLGN